MSEFFSATVGIQLEPYDVYHLASLALIVVTVFLIYRYREAFRTWKHEQVFRYGLACFMIAWELALHAWQIGNGIWTWADSAPFALCGFSLGLGIYVLFTRSFRVFEIGYFWAIGGVASILFPDIPFGPDRFRFYQYMLGHLMFFAMFMYMLFIHEYYPNFQSLKRSMLYLIILVFGFILPLNVFTDANFMFVMEADGTPFEIFEGHGYPLYLTGVVALGLAVMFAWYLPLKFLAPSSRRHDENSN